MLAGNDDSLLSKHNAPQSNVVVEDILMVPLIADFLYRKKASSTAHAALHGYDVNPKIKINGVDLQVHLQKEKVSVFYRGNVLFPQSCSIKNKCSSSHIMSCMQLGRNEDWANGN